MSSVKNITYKRLKHFFWILANIYGRVFGRTYLASFHRGTLIFALHALGYDNGWKSSYTGEEWFITNVLRATRPRVCIDVGANVGTYSRSLLQGMASTVYAFEPATSSFAALSTLQSTFPNRFHPIKKAVGAAVGTATLYSPGERAPTASLDARVVAHTSSETVEVIPLDSFVQDRGLSEVDFIKVDTEGFEKEVFQGMQETLRTLRPRFIQFEFNVLHLRRGDTLLSLCELLEDYTFYRLLPCGLISIDPKSFSNNIFMFCNIVAVRRG